MVQKLAGKWDSEQPIRPIRMGLSEGQSHRRTLEARSPRHSRSGSTMPKIPLKSRMETPFLR